MSDLTNLTKKLDEREGLSFDEAAGAARAMASEEVPALEKEKFLVALAAKGETAQEVAGFAQTFRGLARDPEVGEWAGRAIDVCGTGGDKLGTFNISTTVMFVLAAGGLPVLKHGNRSITSKCGTAELLLRLGVPLEADSTLLRESLRELNFAFFFAPAFHPAFKAVMPVRQALAQKGQRTIFNILGPLINPGWPAYQLLGVAAESWMPMMAGALDAMELKNGYIAHCRLEEGKGMDELSCAGTNLLHGFGESREKREEWTAERFGLPNAALAELTGGDVDQNLAVFHRVVDGGGHRGLVDTICLNAGLAFQIAGKTGTVEEGIELARALLADGSVKRLVAKTAEFFRA